MGKQCTSNCDYARVPAKLARNRKLKAIWHNNRGHDLLESNNLSQALIEFIRATQLDKRLPEAHLNMGVNLALLGRSDCAILPLRIAVRLSNGSPVALFELGEAYLDVLDGGKAYQCFRRVTQVSPVNTDATSLYQLATTRMAQLDKYFESDVSVTASPR